MKVNLGVQFEIPWPPSVNNYWGQSKRGTKFILPKAAAFRRDVIFITAQAGIKQYDEEERLSIHLDLYPPDRRRRDIDNVLKSLLDSLEIARVIHDDSQFDELHVVRHEEKRGNVVVTINIC